MVREEDMMVSLVEMFKNLSPVEFVEEYNRIIGTDFTINEIDWKSDRTNGEQIQYQIW